MGNCWKRQLGACGWAEVGANRFVRTECADGVRTPIGSGRGNRARFKTNVACIIGRTAATVSHLQASPFAAFDALAPIIRPGASTAIAIQVPVTYGNSRAHY